MTSSIVTSGRTPQLDMTYSSVTSTNGAVFVVYPLIWYKLFVGSLSCHTHQLRSMKPWWRKKSGSPGELSMSAIAPPTPIWPPGWGLMGTLVSRYFIRDIEYSPCNYTLPHSGVVGIRVAAV